MYEGDDLRIDGIFMIHPEFIDADGRPITDNIPVPLDGVASMWILIAEMRESVHRLRAKVGVRGHFMEGSRKIGDAEIIRIEGLQENPAG
jgi:hypothetical protein